MIDPTEQIRYTNRELTWLDFNRRVLALAEDDRLPILERGWFLSIWASNLDEFFMVRVAGLKEQVAQGVGPSTPDGMSPGKQLDAIGDLVREHYEVVARLFREELEPLMAKEGIHFTSYDELDEDDQAFLDQQFRERIYPVVTPLAVDPSHPFPYISNLSLNLAITVQHPETRLTRFARVKVPPILPRFMEMPDGERFVPLEEVIAAHLEELFPGMEIVEHHPFRVTRNADIEIEEDRGDDLLVVMETELTRRRFGRAVRLEVQPSMPEEVLDLLLREMNVHENDVYVFDGPLDVGGLNVLRDLDRPELFLQPWTWVTQPRLQTVEGRSPNMFDVVKEGSVLVHHPYDSFTTSVEAFIRQAARDPRVLAIKMTLYRTSRQSPIMRALMEAATQGKQVVALVELKARFDEERNIEWAQRLEDAGVHVVYGVIGLKTHTKIALVVRDEGDRIRRYAHIGTGNYNDTTARIYEDLGLLTSDPAIGADLSDLFNFLTGYSQQRNYRKLVVSPAGTRRRLLELMEEQAELGERGLVTMKMNSLVDEQSIEAMYEASNAGCKIDLIVRGICCLVPGVPGMSENIRVRSIVGRYLEHSRVFRFGARGSGRDYFIGSADLMPRNLDRRVEALAPIEDPDLQFRIDEMFEVLLADDVLAWELGPNGVWTRVPTDVGVDTHLTLRRLAETRASV